jgi:RNA polymerase sigma-70 factor (ECF subfamily)
MLASPQPSAPLGHEVERLIQEARGGSKDALGQLLEAFRLLLLSEAQKKLPAHLLPKEGVSDLVQDTFLKAQRDFLQFAGNGEPELRTWLCRILDHNALNVIRKYETVRRQ